MDDSRLPCSMCDRSFTSMFSLRRHCRTIHDVQVPPRGYGRDSLQEFGCRAVSLDAGKSHVISSDDDDILKSPWASEQDNTAAPDDAANVCPPPVKVTAQQDEPSRENQRSRHVRSSPAASAYIPERRSRADDPSKYLVGELPLTQYVSIIAAVKDLLEQHDAYNIPALCQFVQEKYSTIPPHAVPYVVHAACEGAKYASQMYLVQRAYVGSARPNHLTSAKNAVISLTAWSVGPRPYQHSLSSGRSSTTTPTPTYKPTPRSQLVKRQPQSRQSDTTSDGPSSEDDLNQRRPSCSNVEATQDQPRVVISQTDKIQADKSLNDDHHSNASDAVKPKEDHQVRQPVNPESTDAVAGTSSQPMEVLPELGTDIVSEALMMTGITQLINADDGTLEELIGQQSNAFEEDHVLNVGSGQSCESGTMVASLSQNIGMYNMPASKSIKEKQPDPGNTKTVDKKRARDEVESQPTTSQNDEAVCNHDLSTDSVVLPVEVKKRRKDKEGDSMKSQSKTANDEKESMEKDDDAKKHRKEDKDKKTASKKEKSKDVVSQKENTSKQPSTGEKNIKAVTKKNDGTKDQTKPDEKKKVDSNRPQSVVTQAATQRNSETKKTSNEEKSAKTDNMRSQREAPTKQPGQTHRNWQPRFEPRQTYHGPSTERYRGGNTWNSNPHAGDHRERGENGRGSRERSHSPVYVPKAMMEEFKRFMQDKRRK